MDNFHKYYGRTSNTKDPLNTCDQLSSKKSSLSDYLLYGHVYLPRCRLEALFTQKISSTLQYIISGVSIPYDQDRSHVSFQLQQEGKRFCTEYSYTTDDCLIGVRSLYRFNEPDETEEALGVSSKELKPYWAFGGEIYYSASTKIGGVSFGLRRQNPVSTPSDITLTINPVMGHFSAAYTALMSPNLTASTRYDFNAYSLGSDYILGIEWRNRREGLIKARVSLLQGATLLFSSRYRKLTFTLGLNIASPTGSSPGSSPKIPNPHTMLRSMGIQIQYSS
ncbi:Mitochondrial distribution and morphology protein 10 [Entomophthora muscae]|uniref:Mitochondrial distribution and morphology protein 10 n=1 Tax=Entomophthora muscae TaxID=34485 RepID=A0ACC2RFF8_9FUNG|nr:Mitochondrial distribution and morphology protein 10 [Entomophthora muscae]